MTLAHPRSRGEHRPCSSSTALTVGSSPLARGTFQWFSEAYTAMRLIPARAGNISFLCLFSSSSAAHPRSRGEHSYDTPAMAPRCGSSPLARGTLKRRRLPRRLRRLIPARAGNIGVCEGLGGRGSAHPRSRGEHAEVATSAWRRSGSSPLARGTYWTSGRGDRACRLIPARAGNICCRGRPGCCRAAHPRSRGEHALASASLLRVCGSSPLARGTLPPLDMPGADERLIPARAGNMKTMHPPTRR